MNALTEDDLIIALEKALPEIAEDHEAAATPWSPHDWVPWDDGRNFAFLGGEDWDPSQATLSAEARAGSLALLLTKDNLPSYHRVLAKYFPAFSDWRQLVGVWTAEDNRHAIVLRDYLVVKRAIDPVDSEERRREHVTKGYRQREEQVNELGPLDVLALMAVHENQCVHFISRLAAAVDDDVYLQILAKISNDDRVQADTFAAFLNAGLVADQDNTVVAVDRALQRDEPIGGDIEGFEAEWALIADYENAETKAATAKMLADALKLDTVQGLGDAAEAARKRILELAGRG
ncbi:fatty acid desaturase type 2 [Gordonia bronchialis DSM 43247]|uniref:Fatty acid desaturase type 2 n=1 Tax=Gordonia bronchialis (strain ATCC 25592 / DSM 43247 / BCRC 13721 / JCM 3198 / KCTC 3076 / NBRC 16047 / NCTC 10667) TaxID=526226 RepID=D0L7S1_GORB4|nr:acyl-ACP desaturase [Gordonia bronchialis]ACY20934.1 fatty acid desaturase type 2 [Gordonia bronchialis DSM 43247]MCC3323707.1 acyl-ACP desaturase [Gordonia bronchialis]QGS25340.1 fatty acid desaturase [Gordonia bronchialis]UAK38243.1 acyl-ACP desaturase [Gordonia bronchialis]